MLREVLSNHGIIVTLMNLQELLERLGYPGNKMLPYRDVLRYFWDRSRHSITHQVMTDKHKRYTHVYDYYSKTIPCSFFAVSCFALA